MDEYPFDGSEDLERCRLCDVLLDGRRICPQCGMAYGKGDAEYARRRWEGGTLPLRETGDDGNYASRKADHE